MASKKVATISWSGRKINILKNSGNPFVERMLSLNRGNMQGFVSICCYKKTRGENKIKYLNQSTRKNGMILNS